MGLDPGLGDDGICWNSREMRPQIGKFLILFSKLLCCWVRVPEDLGWKIILVQRETFAQLWCHLVWAGEGSCWVTSGLVWILLHCLAWATTGFYHSPHAGIFFPAKMQFCLRSQEGSGWSQELPVPIPYNPHHPQDLVLGFQVFPWKSSRQLFFSSKQLSVTCMEVPAWEGGDGEFVGLSLTSWFAGQDLSERVTKQKEYKVAFNRMYIAFVEPLF